MGGARIRVGCERGKGGGEIAYNQSTSNGQKEKKLHWGNRNEWGVAGL